ncbi:hypothetical protein BKA00_005818 [Actinomadura coerulea]|uniref:Uncharacterized protein n=1 Tax=Actinomadura coerulea TaxID=46159 RepID=A0A7X0G3Q6_9ACTN|nr:hypothetical protein [Actinomadura coerulea]MBB6398904.1 hypothetical protein [Actinomadura coerulea]GGP98373.1 hypothetical protein GCM10010187_12480 [Actinomadura coerulea]
MTERDPFAVLAEHLGITPEEVGAMGRDDLARIRTATLAERDQITAELREYGITPGEGS